MARLGGLFFWGKPSAPTDAASSSIPERASAADPPILQLVLTELPTRADTVASTLSFTPNLARHLECPDAQVNGNTLREVLDDYFHANPRLRGYLLDDQGALRKHVAIFVNRELIRDRNKLSDAIGDGDEIFVVQALSGG